MTKWLLRKWRQRPRSRRRAVVTAEYLILLTLVGIGVIVGLAAVRNSLLSELCDLAQAISAITP
jgi:hypothetical protein